MAKIEFPRTLYKSADADDPTATKCGNLLRGRAYHSLVVNDETELKAGLEIGYLDDFVQACTGEKTSANSRTTSKIKPKRSEDEEDEPESGSEDRPSDPEAKTKSREIDEDF